MPGYPVKMTIDEIVKGLDKPMEVTVELIVEKEFITTLPSSWLLQKKED